jgi:hypothetical protein
MNGHLEGKERKRLPNTGAMNVFYITRWLAMIVPDTDKRFHSVPTRVAQARAGPGLILLSSSTTGLLSSAAGSPPQHCRLSCVTRPPHLKALVVLWWLRNLGAPSRVSGLLPPSTYTRSSCMLSVWIDSYFNSFGLFF